MTHRAWPESSLDEWRDTRRPGIAGRVGKLAGPEGHWNDRSGTVILPYDAVRTSADPRATLLGSLRGCLPRRGSNGRLGPGRSRQPSHPDPGDATDAHAS